MAWLFHGVMVVPTLLAVLFWVGFCYRSNSLLKSVIKTGSVATLAAIAVMVKAPVLLVAGLALGAVGDWFLSRDHDKAFLTGLIAFACAHLAYIGLIWDGFGWDGTGHAALILVAFCAVMAFVLWPRAGALRWPVMAYVVIICIMGLVALAQPDPQVWLAAGLFIASDTILALELFVLAAADPLRRVTPFAVWGLYWLAQAHFLSAFARIGAA